MEKWLLRFRLWWARRALRKTGYIVVPLAEVQTVDKLVAELTNYASVSGMLNDPRRTKARKRVGHLTEALQTATIGLTKEDA